MYHLNYGVIQGFPAVRKAVTTHVKKFEIFTLVFDIANQVLTRSLLLRHSVRLMNEQQILAILNPRSFVGNFSDYGRYSLQTVTFLEGKKPKYEHKNRKLRI